MELRARRRRGCSVPATSFLFPSHCVTTSDHLHDRVASSRALLGSQLGGQLRPSLADGVDNSSALA